MRVWDLEQVMSSHSVQETSRVVLLSLAYQLAVNVVATMMKPRVVHVKSLEVARFHTLLNISST